MAAAQGGGAREAGAEARAGGPGRQDALELLTRDHREIEQLFNRYKSSADESEKTALAERACFLLKVHARIEEEIFYPAARRRIEDKDLVDEALIEHKAAKELIADIEGARLGDPMNEARMQVLSEQIAHHVREEESELFPEVRSANIDLMGLGARLFARRQEVLEELTAARGQAPGEPRSFEGGRDA
jgi:hemerythrin-like domain-containing protein